MKNLPKIFLPGANLAPLILFGFLMLLVPGKANGFYAHVTGPSYACPNSELTYQYEDDYGGGDVQLCITNGLILNPVTQTWVTCMDFYEGNLAITNFSVKWNNSVIGTIGNIHIKVCDHTATFICSNGDKSVTLGPSPGTPIIYGVDYLYNCIDQQQSYTPVSVPDS